MSSWQPPWEILEQILHKLGSTEANNPFPLTAVISDCQRPGLCQGFGNTAAALSPVHSDRMDCIQYTTENPERG